MEVSNKPWSKSIQYILSKSNVNCPDEWKINKNKSWTLASHPSLPVTNIVNKDNVDIGWMLGFFVSAEGEYLPDKIIFSFSEKITEEHIENNLYKFGGRFVCIIISDYVERVYLDPSGSFSTVFSISRQEVASTSGFLSDDLDYDLLKMLAMPNSGLYYPFGFTAHRNINRLLPNYFLNLKNFETVRHWPLPGQIKNLEIEDVVPLIAKIISQNIEGVIKKNKVCIPLTGGRDSRMLLACAKDFYSEIEFITVRSHQENSDTHIVNILKSKFNLNHRYIYRKKANISQLDEWLKIVGHAVSGFAWKDHQTYSDFDYSRVLMPGICGEVGRGFFYKKFDRESDQVEAKNLLRRMKIPACKVFLPKVDRYISELKTLGLNFFQILDFCYNEQRLGSWAGPSETGGDMFSVGKLWPMCHRQIISSFLNMPTNVKCTNRLPEKIIEHAWPELIKIPFNSFTGQASFLKNLIMVSKKGPRWLAERLRARKIF